MEPPLLGKRFLFTDVKDTGHLLLHFLLEKQSAVVYALVPDFEQVSVLQNEFPGLLLIVMDVKKNWENTRKVLDEALPEVDHVINYAGSKFMEEFTKRRHNFLSVDIDMDELTSERLLKEIKTYQRVKLMFTIPDEEFQPVSLEASETCTDGMFTLRTPKSIWKSFKRFLGIGRPLVTSSDPPNKETVDNILTLQLSQLMREEDCKLRAALNKIHTKGASKWTSSVKRLQSRRTKEIESLTLSIMKWQKEEEKLEKIKIEEQNAVTMSRENSLTREVAQRIVDLRNKHGEKNNGIKFQSERKFQDGKESIDKRLEKDRVTSWEDHYHNILQDQFDQLRSITKKYRKKRAALLFS